MDDETQSTKMDMETHVQPDEEIFDPRISDERPISPVASEPASERAIESHMEHFKCTYDQTWDYSKIAQRFFLSDQPCLVMREHANLPNTHVHFQGFTDIAHGSFQNKLKRLAAHHHSRKINPKSRPISMATRAPDAKGFQYMSKELNPPLYSHGFSEDELLELREKSKGYVKAIKTKLSDFIKSVPTEEFLKIYRVPGTNARILLQKTALLCYDSQKESGISYSARYTKQDMIQGLLNRPDIPRQLAAELLCL